MSDLQGKKILLGICGSIAAYKAAFLTRLLIKAGADVQVVMTPTATAFITPLTLSTLSKNPVFTEVSNAESWNNHVELGLWADAMVIAPLTATTLGKLANGICDTILAAVYLSARCPVFFAPAMDLDMWQHPATQQNVQKLESFGNQLIPVGTGELASGLAGPGRMAEPDEIVAFLTKSFPQEQDFENTKVLITAGPTYEAIDPVRFIGNRSSGKMGIALAEEFARRGATVDVILGPSQLTPRGETIHLTKVESAQQMYEAAQLHFEKAHIAVLAAAVADYRPAEVAAQKIKKKTDELTLKLAKTPDIAASLGQQKRPDQLLIGFALETNDALENARSKLQRKNLDLIILNSLSDAGAGFHHDTNKVSIVYPGNKVENFELKTKAAVAKDIVDAVLALSKK